jgi:hypothetical protein
MPRSLAQSAVTKSLLLRLPPPLQTLKKAAAAETTDGSTLSLSGLLNSLDGAAAAEGPYVYLLPLCIPFNF